MLLEEDLDFYDPRLNRGKAEGDDRGRWWAALLAQGIPTCIRFQPCLGDGRLPAALHLTGPVDLVLRIQVLAEGHAIHSGPSGSGVTDMQTVGLNALPRVFAMVVIELELELQFQLNCLEKLNLHNNHT